MSCEHAMVEGTLDPLLAHRVYNRVKYVTDDSNVGGEQLYSVTLRMQSTHIMRKINTTSCIYL